MIEQIDQIVRMIAVGAGLMLVAQLAAGAIRAPLRMAAVATAITLIAQMIAAPAPAAPSDAVPALASLAALASPLALWLLAQQLLGRAASRRITLVVGAALVMAWAADSFIPATGRTGFFIGNLIALGLVADIVRITIPDTARDGANRAVALWLPGLALVQSGISATAEIATFPFRIPAALELLCSTATLALIVFIGLALFRPASQWDEAEDRDTQQ
ncbi:hypothetical protein EH30_03100 [Erythrobacter sp. JL475]|nr:hypothetical protein EH30_03100 [Erythrobacter sp. JL475]